MNDRNAMLGRLHQLKKLQGLDDDAYRDKLERLTGKRSATELSEEQLAAAVASFHGKHSHSAHPHHAKVKALWIAAWNLGGLAHGDDAALDAFVARQTGKQRLAFITPPEANSVTEALKSICSRHGFEPLNADPGGMENRRLLAKAQWQRLFELGAVRIADVSALENYAEKKYLSFHGGLIHLKRHQLDNLAKTLGSWIRKAKAKAAA